jgi:hypothetical protein
MSSPQNARIFNEFLAKQNPAEAGLCGYAAVHGGTTPLA